MDDSLLAAYLRRCYHAVDGLWFVMAEQAYGLDAALELDRQVWEVLAKIQARQARTLLQRSGNDPKDLARCFSLKLSADGHEFELQTEPAAVTFTITGCPWKQLLEKSGRMQIALRVAEVICLTEGRVWCAEFGDGYSFEMGQMACAGGDCCRMRFQRA